MQQDSVRVHKVCVPSYYAWPSNKIILYVCYSKEEAERFIENHPNQFLKLWMTIEWDVLAIRETD